MRLNVYFLKFAATKCSYYVLVFHAIFMPVNDKRSYCRSFSAYYTQPLVSSYGVCMYVAWYSFLSKFLQELSIIVIFLFELFSRKIPLICSYLSLIFSLVTFEKFVYIKKVFDVINKVY